MTFTPNWKVSHLPPTKEQGKRVPLPLSTVAAQTYTKCCKGCRVNTTVTCPPLSALPGEISNTSVARYPQAIDFSRSVLFTHFTGDPAIFQLMLGPHVVSHASRWIISSRLLFQQWMLLYLKSHKTSTTLPKVVRASELWTQFLAWGFDSRNRPNFDDFLKVFSLHNKKWYCTKNCTMNFDQNSEHDLNNCKHQVVVLLHSPSTVKHQATC